MSQATGANATDGVLRLAQSILKEAQVYESETNHDSCNTASKNRILASCSELIASLYEADAWMMRAAMGYSSSVALSLAFSMRIAEHIHPRDPVSLETLVEHTGSSEKLISISSLCKAEAPNSAYLTLR
jgi:hypothetical protein